MEAGYSLVADFDIAVTQTPAVQVSVTQEPTLRVSAEDDPEVAVAVTTVEPPDIEVSVSPPLRVEVLPVGGGDDLSYIHTQNIAASTWSITHNLGKFPSVTLVDGTGSEMEATVVHGSTNSLTVTFSQAESGQAYLN